MCWKYSVFDFWYWDSGFATIFCMIAGETLLAIFLLGSFSHVYDLLMNCSKYPSSSPFFSKARSILSKGLYMSSNCSFCKSGNSGSKGCSMKRFGFTLGTIYFYFCLSLISCSYISLLAWVLIEGSFFPINKFLLLLEFNMQSCPYSSSMGL